MIQQKKIFMLILIIILIGNVSAYLKNNFFLVGTVSIVKDKIITAEKINQEFSVSEITSQNSKNSIQFNTISLNNYEKNNCQENFCYQENPKDLNNCGAISEGDYSYKIDETKGFIYITYSKPLKANNKSLWQVKWGYDSSSKKPYYLRYQIPLTCWNQKKLQFKIYSGDPSNYEIGGYCFNGSHWQNIFFESYKSISEKIIKASPLLALDGDYSTGVAQGYYKNEQKWFKAISPEHKNSIYEEGMRWYYPNSNEKIEYEQLNYQNKTNDLKELIYLTNNEKAKPTEKSKHPQIFLLISFIVFLLIFLTFLLLRKSHKISKRKKEYFKKD